MTGFVSNGNATPQVLEFIRPHIDLYKVDLKSFDDAHYRKLGGRIQPILDSIKRIHQIGFWLEIVTLLIPGFNNSDDEIRRLTEFVAGVSPDIPWHVTAFHQDYRMTDEPNTTAEDLLRAAEIGKQSGLRYIYPGNLPGRVGAWENTHCVQCGETLIERHGYRVRSYHLTSEGACPTCGTKLPGRFTSGFDGQIASHPFAPNDKRTYFPIVS